MNTIKSLKVWLIILIITGCTNMCGTSHNAMGPEEVVEAYLDVAFNISEVDGICKVIRIYFGKP